MHATINNSRSTLTTNDRGRDIANLLLGLKGIVKRKRNFKEENRGEGKLLESQRTNVNCFEYYYFTILFGRRLR